MTNPAPKSVSHLRYFDQNRARALGGIPGRFWSIGSALLTASTGGETILPQAIFVSTHLQKVYDNYFMVWLNAVLAKHAMRNGQPSAQQT